MVDDFIFVSYNFLIEPDFPNPDLTHLGDWWNMVGVVECLGIFRWEPLAQNWQNCSNFQDTKVSHSKFNIMHSLYAGLEIK